MHTDTEADWLKDGGQEEETREAAKPPGKWADVITDIPH